MNKEIITLFPANLFLSHLRPDYNVNPILIHPLDNQIPRVIIPAI